MYRADKFEGACIDSGAELSFIGLQQDKAYAKATGRNINPSRFPLTFTFGDGESTRKGVINIRIPLPNDRHIAIDVHTVEENIPNLIGIEIFQ